MSRAGVVVVGLALWVLASGCRDNDGLQRVCEPVSCAGQCGVVSNACGASRDCGPCDTPNPPCTPKTCQELGAACGAHSDGCGGSLACGSCGDGASCQRSSERSVCVAQPRVPGPPTDVSATARDTTASVSWKAPAHDGGSPITGYVLKLRPGEHLLRPGPVLTTSVEGLTRGTSYVFTVRAVNAVGEGPESAPATLVIPEPPCRRTLEPQPPIPTGPFSHGVALGDVDGDGRLDVIVASSTQEQLTVLRNVGGGRLVKGGTVRAPGANTVVARDFTGDGAVDLAALGGQLTVLQNDGSGRFSVTSSLESGPMSHLAAGDVDGDGDVDLVGGGPSARQGGAVWWRNTAGVFTQERIFWSGRDASASLLQDFDGDGRTDVVAAGAFDKALFPYLPGAGGAFTASEPVATAMSAGDLTPGDWNGDRRADVAVGSERTLQLFFGGPGPAPLVEGPRYVEPGSPVVIKGLASADLEGDGRAEVIVLYAWGWPESRGEAVVFRATEGALTLVERHPVGQNPQRAAVGDLDGDGFDDLAVANADDDTLSILLNRCLPGAASP